MTPLKNSCSIHSKMFDIWSASKLAGPYFFSTSPQVPWKTSRRPIFAFIFGQFASSRYGDIAWRDQWPPRSISAIK
ncbi:MAG: hypothetical protein BWY66_01836 [bacterium ADurb.Bin374]|nr:MAG: hypothetical protein BWY66_01836 [bacterium ADurb.Bin374]